MGMQRPSEGAMQIPHDALLLRIFTSVDDRFGLEPLHLAIVDRAHAMNMAGATVLRGSLGFGSSRRMHEPRLSPFRVDTPVVVEIVDSEEKIEAFLPVLDEMMESGLVTLEKARVLQYGRRRAGLLARFRDEIRHRLHLEQPSRPPTNEGGSSMRAAHPVDRSAAKLS
jgi:uncharacterized protein